MIMKTKYLACKQYLQDTVVELNTSQSFQSVEDWQWDPTHLNHRDCNTIHTNWLTDSIATSYISVEFTSCIQMHNYKMQHIFTRNEKLTNRSVQCSTLLRQVLRYVKLAQQNITVVHILYI